jgi:hypothetical protein
MQRQVGGMSAVRVTRVSRAPSPSGRLTLYVLGQTGTRRLGSGKGIDTTSACHPFRKMEKKKQEKNHAIDHVPPLNKLNIFKMDGRFFLKKERSARQVSSDGSGQDRAATCYNRPLSTKRRMRKCEIFIAFSFSL